MATAEPPLPIHGGCTCRLIRYALTSRPLIVQACHCSRCQHESGSAFAVNALIEADRVTLLSGPNPHSSPSSGSPETIRIRPEVGKGQTATRCPRCGVVLWSEYDGPGVRFVKVGTLDEPGAWGTPEAHIFTASKMPWVVLPPRGGEVVVEELYYERREGVWRKESLERIEALERRIEGK
ncbi:hypothetical protein MMC20_004146 [Loxospora ochrophaea]|nr:hypothetical protein [Loxospora ochrophaea]